MMGGTIILYLLLGLVVAVALAARTRAGWSTRVGWCLLWPFYAPLLFDQPPTAAPDADPITRARVELRAALTELPADTRRLLADEIDRVVALTDGMTRIAEGVADIDAVLATASFDPDQAESIRATLEARGCPPGDPRMRSVLSRLENIERLRALRARRAADLEAALLTLQALTSEVRLLGCASFGQDEAPAAIAQVTALVRALAEGLFAPDEALV